jgi:hypothetical protein
MTWICVDNCRPCVRIGEAVENYLEAEEGMNWILYIIAIMLISFGTIWIVSKAIR